MPSKMALKTDLPKDNYTVGQHTSHVHMILFLLLTKGSLTHEECEEYTEAQGNKCTVLRSRIPEIRYPLGWPVVARGERNKAGTGTHARYFMVLEQLGIQANISVESLVTAAKAWDYNHRRFGPLEPFLDWARSVSPRRLLSEEAQTELFVEYKVSPAPILGCQA